MTEKKDNEVWKEKVIHTGEKCRVTYHSIHSTYGVDGGHEEVYIEVTDDTSQQAKKTLDSIIHPTQESKVKLNERASKALGEA